MVITEGRTAASRVVTERGGVLTIVRQQQNDSFREDPPPRVIWQSAAVVDRRRLLNALLFCLTLCALRTGVRHSGVILALSVPLSALK